MSRKQILDAIVGFWILVNNFFFFLAGEVLVSQEVIFIVKNILTCLIGIQYFNEVLDDMVNFNNFVFAGTFRFLVGSCQASILLCSFFMQIPKVCLTAICRMVTTYLQRARKLLSLVEVTLEQIALGHRFAMGVVAL